jgi:hypothetical protein
MKVAILTLLLISIICLVNTQAHDEGHSVSAVQKVLSHYMDEHPKELFKVYHFLFEKEYDLNSEEGIRKYRVFKENLKEIKEINSKGYSYKAGLGPYSDLTKEEFKNKIMMNPKVIDEQFVKRFLSYVDFDIAAEKDEEEKIQNVGATIPFVMPEVDWRNVTGRVRNQHSCGDCYVESTVDAYRGVYALKNNDAGIAFSTQYVLDCSKNFACSGGDPNVLLTWALTNGFVPETNYKSFAGQKQSCAATDSTPKIYPKGVNSTYYISYTDKQLYLNNYYEKLSKGPMVVLIDGVAILPYSSGIAQPRSFPCNARNHAVLAVGFGRSVDPATGQLTEYILIKNSWGKNWGENGYMRLAIDYSFINTCYVHDMCYQPVF